MQANDTRALQLPDSGGDSPHMLVLSYGGTTATGADFLARQSRGMENLGSVVHELALYKKMISETEAGELYFHHSRLLETSVTLETEYSRLKTDQESSNRFKRIVDIGTTWRLAQVEQKMKNWEAATLKLKGNAQRASNGARNPFHQSKGQRSKDPSPSGTHCVEPTRPAAIHEEPSPDHKRKGRSNDEPGDYIPLLGTDCEEADQGPGESAHPEGKGKRRGLFSRMPLYFTHKKGAMFGSSGGTWYV